MILGLVLYKFSFVCSQGPNFVLKMKLSITLKTGTTTDSASRCGAQLLSQMDNFTARITVDNCGNASFLPPSDSQGQAACFPGSAHVRSQYCCELVFLLHCLVWWWVGGIALTVWFCFV